MIGLLIHGDLLHLGNGVRHNDAPLQPSSFLNFLLSIVGKANNYVKCVDSIKPSKCLFISFIKFEKHIIFLRLKSMV